MEKLQPLLEQCSAQFLDLIHSDGPGGVARPIGAVGEPTDHPLGGAPTADKAAADPIGERSLETYLRLSPYEQHVLRWQTDLENRRRCAEAAQLMHDIFVDVLSSRCTAEDDEREILARIAPLFEVYKSSLRSALHERVRPPAPRGDSDRMQR